MKPKSEEIRDIMDKIDFDKLLTERYIEVNQTFKPVTMSGKFKVYFLSDYMKNNSDKEFVKISEKEKKFLIETFQRQYGLTITQDDIAIDGKYIVITFTLSKKNELKDVAPVFNSVLKMKFNGKVLIADSEV